MAEVSDQLLVVTIMTYLAALVAYAAEYAFGSATRVSRVANRELVGPDGLAVVVDDEPAPVSPRDRYIGYAVLGLSVAATLAHAATLITRAVAAGRVPWGNMYEFLLALTLVGSVAWLVVLFARPAVRALGLLVTTVVIVLLGTSGMLHTDAGPLVPALNSYWLAIHVSAVATAGGVLLVGFVSAVLYLLRDGYENGRTGFPFALAAKAPAAATIERLTFRVHAFAFPILTVGIMCGAIWAEAAWGRYWGWDPKEVWSFITWVIYAGYLHARATPSIKRRTASWLAIAGWAAVVFNTYGVNLVFSGLHSYAGV
ncbi:c-type cytochrome biogenesis protein CcsB [Virgisporangium aliadipatigenens]|uniref:C-type cytochrome biogenesis protein CcsB n=1 Tax=Virgisporangium aliadipatigenens TaxID=741659 RepID=A0A8J3YMU6_9ACTN|nr:c-type cytochrome biogenesis protein CcsB [Virgisporangium aliadipatigenens]GIJ47297.1 c-type cytochrome biogenesis protein CcsB [Virgisporangium aliadipatigenens]